MNLPDQFFERLTLPERVALKRVLNALGEILPEVYANNVRDHRDRDNANIFGLRVSVHTWACVDQSKAELGGALPDEHKNARFLRIGSVRVAIHKLGHTEGDDIHSSFPEGTPSQRAYGMRNANQYTLFDAQPEAPLPAERAYALRDLVIGHFGNPEDGFQKWYIGAFVYDEHGRPRWAWVERQSAEAIEVPEAPTAYDKREVPAIAIRPRRTLREEGGSGTVPGA